MEEGLYEEYFRKLAADNDAKAMVSESYDYDISYLPNIQEPIKLSNGKCFNITASIGSGYILTIEELPTAKTCLPQLL